MFPGVLFWILNVVRLYIYINSIGEKGKKESRYSGKIGLNTLPFVLRKKLKKFLKKVEKTLDICVGLIYNKTRSARENTKITAKSLKKKLMICLI